MRIGTIDTGVLPPHRARAKPALRDRFLRALELTVTSIPFIFLAISALIQFTHPGYNPWQDAISTLVWGPWGWVQTALFFLLAFSVIAQVIKLSIRAAQTVRLRIGIASFALMGVAFILIGLHPTDIPGAPPSPTGVVHLQTSAALIFLFPLTCFLVAPELRLGFRQKWLRPYTRTAGAVGFALIAATAVFVTGNHGWVGLLERLMVLNGLAWMQVIGILAL